MTDPARLYEEDWYAWTQRQAALLRAWPPGQRPNELDLEHIAEEIEDLGTAEIAAIEGLLTRLIEHLLKMELHPDERPLAHWRKEVGALRIGLSRRLRRSRAPTLWSRRAAIYADVWPDGARLFANDLEADGLDVPPGTETPRYDLDAQVLDPDWYPVRGGERPT